MATQIFINLPVKNLQQSIDFFTKLGFTFNPQFTDDSATCMIIADNIFAMLLTETRFKDFTSKDIVDAKKATEVLIALDAESRDKVDEMISNAKKAGGTIYMQSQDHGWMYAHGFADLDGHQWEILYMDKNAIPQDMASVEAQQ
ncbi:MAG TPA: VOC family protein [Chitinophagaceae bacterium]